MSLAEIKKEADNLSSDEVIYLAAWFHHQARRRDPSYLSALDAAWDEMEAGDRISLSEYRRLPDNLTQSGL